jgi:hypothetical protein
MPDKIQYIVDNEGNRKAVIIDYDAYLKLVEMMEDMDLIRAMEEAEDSESVSGEEIFEILDSDEH